MPRAGLTTESVVQAAAELANAQGLQAVTLAELAKQLRIKSPSLYNHIKSLADLHAHLQLRGLRQLLARMEAALRKASTGDALTSLPGNDPAQLPADDLHQQVPADGLQLAAAAYIQFAREQPGLYAASLRAPGANNLEAQQTSAKIVAMLVGLFAPYRLSEEDTLHAIRGIRSLLHGFADLEQAGGFGLPLEVDRSASIAIDIFVRGLLSAASRADET